MPALAFLLFLTLQAYDPDGYIQQIEKTRRTLDEKFTDPLSSPLATFAILRLEKDTVLIGSGPDADFRLKHPSVRLRHARLVQNGQSYKLEALEGQVSRIDKTEITSAPWKPNDHYRIGKYVLVLQVHPVGPVLRAIDPEAEEVRRFSGLHYFPVDPGYRVLGEIRPTPSRAVTILDTQGWERKASIYGKLVFELSGKGQELDLILFEPHPTSKTEFMLIFQDQTSGRESYPACRYLWLPFQSEGHIWVDFNLASNPLCAYNKGFACPLPLPGNRLSVAVRAGEKNYP